MTFKVTSYLRIAFVLHKAQISQQSLSLYPYFLQFFLFGKPSSLVTLDHGQLNSLILQAQWNERFGPRVPRYHRNARNRGDEHIACSAVCCRLKINAPCALMWSHMISSFWKLRQDFSSISFWKLHAIYQYKHLTACSFLKHYSCPRPRLV